MSQIPSVAVAKSGLGVATRLHKSPEQVADARRVLAEAKLAAYVAKTVAAAPPLSPEAADAIAALLRPGGPA